MYGTICPDVQRTAVVRVTIKNKADQGSVIMFVTATLRSRVQTCGGRSFTFVSHTNFIMFCSRRRKNKEQIFSVKSGGEPIFLETRAVNHYNKTSGNV
jgi:hypothetical protein